MSDNSNPTPKPDFPQQSDPDAVPEFDAPRNNDSPIIVKLKEYREYVLDLEAEIARLRGQIAEAKDAARDYVGENLPTLINPDERTSTASEIYWLYADLIDAASLAPALNVKPGSVYKAIWPLELPSHCVRCGKPMSHLVKSRSDLGLGFYETCDDCAQDERLKSEEKQNAYRAELQRLKTMPYQDYLQTEHWQNLRHRMLKRAHFRCQVCNRNDVTLQVHHRTYERRGQEEYADLIVLCADCHKTFHENGRLTK